jgi:hypothetical protein
MNDEANSAADRPGDPREAQPGRGAPGNQWAVQTAQTTSVNPADAKIPSGANVELNKQQLEAARASEEGTDLKTTDGYIIDEAGQIDNVAIEPEIYVEER